jgi:hypothetical protein
VPRNTNARRVACLVLCAGVVTSAAHAEPLERPHPGRQPLATAYYAGKPVTLSSVPPRRFMRGAPVGPWQLGRPLHHKPQDARPNIYVVVPGTQHHAEGWDAYDLNVVLSTLPDKMVEWDVYWVVVLDPGFRQDLRDERDLIMAAQQEFTPGEMFELSDVPGADFLRKMLKIESLAGLDPYRRKNGALPNLIIVPAGFGIQAEAQAEGDRVSGEQRLNVRPSIAR